MDRIANSNYELESNEGAVTPELLYHVQENIPLHESIYRIGSNAYCTLMEDARRLNKEGMLKLANANDDFVVNKTAAGKRAIYEGKSVVLDSPKRNPGGSKKKFHVYVDSGRKDKEGRVLAKKVQWGDPDMEIRNYDEDAAKSFRNRHQCDQKSDKTTPGYWACNVAKYWKQLGLSSSRPW